MRRRLPSTALVSLLALGAAGTIYPQPLMAQQAGDPHQRGGKGVRQLFDDAQKLYEAGKFPQALAAYNSILRRFPTHEPALIQTAKTLYRLDQIKDAHTVFQRINPQHLDPETSYEYGWSFYSMKQWEGGLYGFQRVPKNHALYDLANYYGGICAIKIKRYEEAGEMLEKAVVLPDKLAKSRALYVKHLQALILMQQKSALSKERQAERDRVRAEKKKRKGGNETKPAAPGSYKHNGRREVDKFAKVKYATERQYIEYSGLKTTEFDARIATLDLRSGLIVPLPMKFPKDRRAAVGGHVMLAFEDRNTTGKAQSILIHNNDDLSRIQQTTLDATHLQSGIVGMSPWIEFPLPQNSWLSLGGDINFLYPDFGRQGRTGTRKGYVSLGGVAKELEYDVEVNYSEILNTKTKPITTIVGAKAVLAAPIMKQLTATGKVIFNQYDYVATDLEVDGPDTTTRGEASLTQEFGFGISLELLGAYENNANAQFHRIPTYGQLGADGNVTSGMVQLVAEPVPWFSLTAYEIISKTDWALKNEEQREVFERNISDYIESFKIEASINLFF